MDQLYIKTEASTKIRNWNAGVFWFQIRKEQDDDDDDGAYKEREKGSQFQNCC